MFICGLLDAGSAYYGNSSSNLIDNGYIRSKMDPCLFYRVNEEEEITYIMIHVDDTLVCSNSDDHPPE